VQKGDKVIIVAYASINVTDAQKHKPTVVFVDDQNHFKEIRKEKRATKTVY
jgi:aspartate 1-decarboxylase